MKTHKNLYSYLCSMGNLTLAWRNARKGKTSTPAVIEFEKDLERNLLNLHNELVSKDYQPKPLTTFVLRDPKTRIISKSDFRDRVIHHALILVIEHIFEKAFIYDSCANQIGKGNLFALKRLRTYWQKDTLNYTRGAFCLKADIKHYFDEVNHETLIYIIKHKIADEKVIWLIRQILNNISNNHPGKGMPLGNLTSQFFANVYLNELDYFVKHELKAKFYIRYVDDFVILHHSKKQLESWKGQIDNFLGEKLMLELHPNKSRIVPLSRGIDFVGFRNFSKHQLLRKRNIRSMLNKVNDYIQGNQTFGSIFDSYKGWKAYARLANSYKLQNKIKISIIDALMKQV